MNWLKTAYGSKNSSDYLLAAGMLSCALGLITNSLTAAIVGAGCVAASFYEKTKPPIVIVEKKEEKQVLN